MLIYVDGTTIELPDNCLYDPFPMKGQNVMNPEDEEPIDPQDCEEADNDGTGRPGTGE